MSKESKIPKIPILKPDSGSLSVSTRTRSATMNNQIARRGTLSVHVDLPRPQHQL